MSVIALVTENGARARKREREEYRVFSRAGYATSIYPVLHALGMRDPPSPIVSPFNFFLGGDDARVSEIMKFRRCRSNAR